MTRTLPYFLAMLLLTMMSSVAQAQLFGTRSLGQPLSRRSAASAVSTTGEISGNERFLRENRGGSDFVGSDQGDQRGFVGSQQARGRGSVISSTTGLREKTDRSSQINRALPAIAKNAMYPPRIQLGELTIRERQVRSDPQLAAQLVSSRRFSTGCHFSVSVAGRQATVQGEVASARERHLAELVLLLEPGIESVVNQLKVTN